MATATVSPADVASGASLYTQYPISSAWELTLSNDDVVSGTVYCTDPIANVVVLQESKDSSILVVSVSEIKSSKQTAEATDATPDAPVGGISQKVIDDKEKRAIKLAQESFAHLNPKASPKGQLVFDRLLKACNEVVWKGEDIIVLNAVQVVAPYGQDNCTLLGTGKASALERVQKIVEAAA